MDKARDLALKIIHDVHEGEAYANVVLAQYLRKSDVDGRDRRFVTELVYGTVRARGTLDWIIRKYVARPLSKLDSMILDILRMGVYQLKYMDKVTEPAACNESVELAKQYGNSGSVKFVNGVLRTMIREPEKADFPIGQGKATTALALEEMHPEWMVRRWIKEFGYGEAELLCQFDNRQPPLCLRTNTLQTSRSELLLALLSYGVEAHASDIVPEGIILDAHDGLDNLIPLQQGYAQVQDESSMLVAHVVDPQPNELILDICSAPGGKATHMAALMKDMGRIIALDIYDHKLQRVQENAQRLGITCIETVNMDARDAWKEYAGRADKVLVDAPCSGLGVLRRKVDSRWRKTPEMLKELPKLQLEILRSGAASVKTGGILVYSTCTIAREENQDVIKSFLEGADNFELLNAGQRLPIIRDEEMVQLYPQRDGTDGFFIACMRRKA